MGGGWRETRRETERERRGAEREGERERGWVGGCARARVGGCRVGGGTQI